MTPVVDLPNAKNERRMDYFVFLQEPISATFIVLSAVIVAMSLRVGAHIEETQCPPSRRIAAWMALPGEMPW